MEHNRHLQGQAEEEVSISEQPKAPVQRRGRETQERIVNAADAILSEDGPAALTVKAVMARAGVGPGSFYARFDGREALLAHVQALFWRRCEAEVQQLGADEALRAAERAKLAPELVRRLVRAHTANEAGLRALMAEAIRRPGGDAMERVVFLNESLTDTLERLLQPEPGQVVSFRAAWVQVLGALRTLLLFPDESPLDPACTDEDLILELTRTVMSSLGEADGMPASYRELLTGSAGIYKGGPTARGKGAPE
jgi:AcrR family transcriptional regulator